VKVLGLVVVYLIGSIPVGFLISRMLVLGRFSCLD